MHLCIFRCSPQYGVLQVVFRQHYVRMYVPIKYTAVTFKVNILFKIFFFFWLHCLARETLVP